MDFSRLKRAIQPMPDDVRERLRAENLLEAYARRPAYQQNDYLSCFARAKRTATRQKRIDQMADELRDGGLYMGMQYNGA